MAERIQDTFEHLAARRRAALVAYAVAGDPDRMRGREVLLALARTADVLEIGVPCRNPFRDGPAIAAAHDTALAAGGDWREAMSAARSVRAAAPDLPVVLLLYSETLRAAGPGPFFQAAADAGVDGLLVVDLLERALPWWAPMAAMAGLILVPIVTPGADDGASAARLAGARGFVYCAAAASTGGTAPDVDETARFLTGIRELTTLPRVLGFGIRTPEIAAALAPHAEGLAVGTAFVETVRRAVEAGRDPARAVALLAEEFSRVLRKGG
jgi:tryptophan synthase alpha chain